VNGVAVIIAKRRLQRRRRRLWSWLTPTGEVPEVAAAPHDVEIRQTLEAVHEMLDRLRPEERIALILHRVDGLTIADAARAMGLSESTYKRRFRRGEQRLLEMARGSATVRTWLAGGLVL
jgi:DNA-directed RNA polymerase specialized sigma24 family protein